MNGSYLYKIAAQCLHARLTLACMAKQTSSHCTVYIEAFATPHRLTMHSSFLRAAKPSNWINLSHILFIIISIILNNAHLMMYYEYQAETLTPITS